MTVCCVTKSATTGVVVLDTRVCRQANCLNEAFGHGIGYQHTLWYRKEGMRLASTDPPYMHPHGTPQQARPIYDLKEVFHDK